MIEVNIFSGQTYSVSGNTKIRDDGTTFVRSGSMWYGPNGQVVQQSGNIFRNLNTGVQSNFGDPFGEDDDLDI